MLNITPPFPFYVLIACHLSQIYLQSEIKRGFVWPKTFNCLFQKPSNFYSEKMSCSLKVFFSINIGRNNFQFSWNLWEINMNMNFFTSIFLVFFFFLTFQEHVFKEHIWVAASIYFNGEASQKCEYTTHQTNLRGIIISWTYLLTF